MLDVGEGYGGHWRILHNERGEIVETGKGYVGCGRGIWWPLEETTQ